MACSLKCRIFWLGRAVVKESELQAAKPPPGLRLELKTLKLLFSKVKQDNA